MFYDRNPGDARVKVGSERQAASSPARRITHPSKSLAWWYGFCPRGPSKIGPAIGRITPIKPPILRWDFLWKSYSLSHSKQIWTTNRSVYTMFFMNLVVFATQILAFAICFSWILRVGAVQANTFCVDVWNSHEKTNNLKFKKAGFSAKSQRFPRFCTPNPQIWAENRRFAALAKRNHQKTADLQPWPSEIVPKPGKPRNNKKN